MSGYDNEGKFVLFRNDKGDNPKRPDYRGSFVLDGVEFELSGWIRESKKDGSKFISGDVTEKKARGGGSGPGGGWKSRNEPPRREEPEPRGVGPFDSAGKYAGGDLSPQQNKFDDDDVPF